MNKQLSNNIQKEIINLWPDDKQIQKDCMKRINKWFVPGLNDIIKTKFKSKKCEVIFVGMGGSNVVVKINNKTYCTPNSHIFRIAYKEPKQEYENDVKYEFEILNKHDFGINPPIDYKFEVGKYWWYEVKEMFKVYQGATIKQYSKLFHKVFKLHKYGLFWFDVHGGNIMHDEKRKFSYS